jgi:hypothetical protein
MRLIVLGLFLLISLPSMSQKLFDNSSISHVSCGFMIGSATSTFVGKTPTERLIYGTLSGTLVGLLKELGDNMRTPNSGNFGDLLSTTAGSFTGSLMVNYIINKNSNKKRRKKVKVQV